MVRNELENGIMSDWGSFPGEGRGYAVVSGSKLEVMRMVEQYSPFVKFRVHPVASILDTDELIKSLTG